MKPQLTYLDDKVSSTLPPFHSDRYLNMPARPSSTTSSSTGSLGLALSSGAHSTFSSPDLLRSTGSSTDLSFGSTGSSSRRKRPVVDYKRAPNAAKIAMLPDSVPRELVRRVLLPQSLSERAFVFRTNPK
eukprot:TRINITY_DN45882_c0_g1_i1.p2 TRINITY_DN45882_c0_g1~~TRINITY_DN45882_c0_g1_i1.p2  ORF type:complete len:130 (+),score=9.41 TRINITY_DN45882_c0_g1_i1:111-500(+)